MTAPAALDCCTAPQGLAKTCTPSIALPQPRASRLGLLQYMPCGLRVSGQREDSHDDEQREAGIAERSNHSRFQSEFDQIFVRCLTQDQDVICSVQTDRTLA